jgi:hypothetical protein
MIEQTVNVERYALNFETKFKLGTAGIFTMKGHLDDGLAGIKMRVQRIVANCPVEKFVKELAIDIDGFPIRVPDAFVYGPECQMTYEGIPTLSSYTPVAVRGKYTGLVPPPFVKGNVFHFLLTLQGPAVVVP